MQADNDTLTLPYIAQMIITVLRGGPHREALLCGFQTHWFDGNSWLINVLVF